MALAAPGSRLMPERRELPAPAPGQVRIAVTACGVCRTDLHIVDGELPFPGHAVVPGHEVVGRVEAIASGVHDLQPGQRVGVAWLGRTCGQCEHCRAGRENLCRAARFTGWQLDGGYASHLFADARYVLPLPTGYSDEQAAPLLCAGLIGHRAYAMAKALTGADVQRVGLYGFGAAAHLIAQIAVHEGQQVYAFTRPGDSAAQAMASRLGATWAGGSDQAPPAPLDAAILFAPIGALVPIALRAVRPGGSVICAGIHMSDIPSFPYALLWEERRLASVANLTRADGAAFLRVASLVPLVVETHRYALTDANRALDDLRRGRFTGAAVLVP